MLLRSLGLFVLTVSLAVAPTLAFAADGEAQSSAGWPKPTRSVQSGEKLCKYKFSDGLHKVWVCKKEEPCCQWELLNNYVKCGSTITGCL